MDEHQQKHDSALEDLIRYDRAEWQEWNEWNEGDEYEYESETDDEETEEPEDAQGVTSEESYPDFQVVEVEKRKQSILRRRTDKKLDAFRRLLAGSRKLKQSVSIETIVTLEDEEVRSATPASSSSSRIHPCFKTVDISDSQLELLNLFRTFPVPDDPGNVQAFWVLYDPVPIYPNDGIKRFLDTMKALKLKPIAGMSTLLRSDTINLRYYGLDPRAVKAITESVCYNSSVQSLDLKDNWLTPEACVHLNNLLLDSGILGSMALSGCRIGREGIEKMLTGIARSWSLVELDLSGCRLGDDGLNLLAPVVGTDKYLQILNLSDNRLGSNSAQALQAMLARNTSLLKLNLSWNGLSTKEASSGLFKGLIDNKTLDSLNLSWNAFAKEALGPLCSFLQQNGTLVTLNLSGNRFDEQAGNAIARSLAKNVGLREINLGDNPLKPFGGSAIVHALIPEQSPNTALKHVGLENVWVDKDVLPDLERIRNERPWLEVKLGGIFSNYELIGPDERRILLKRANFEGIKPKKKKQRREFGHFILSLEDKLNSRDKFKELVKAFKIKLSASLVDALMASFAGGNKKVDQTAMKALYLEQYPDTKAPPTPMAKKKKGKKDKPAGEDKKEGKDDKTEGKSEDKSKKRNVRVAKTQPSESGTEKEFDDEEGGEN